MPNYWCVFLILLGDALRMDWMTGSCNYYIQITVKSQSNHHIGYKLCIEIQNTNEFLKTEDWRERGRRWKGKVVFFF